jgi:hypothetical protein
VVWGGEEGGLGKTWGLPTEEEEEEGWGGEEKEQEEEEDCPSLKLWR